MKQCGIYRIAFSNGKSYIGQSVDIETRFKDHYRASHPEKYKCKNGRDEHLPVHKAMAKYEKENGYSLEILEVCSPAELNEKEKYWIQYYNSSIDKNGYNIAEGGQNNFALKQEHHSQAKLTEKEVQQIKKEILKREKTFREIAKEFNVSPATITNINTGKNWSVEGEKYPLISATNDFIARQNMKKQRKFSDNEVKLIRKMRNQEHKTLSEISDYFNNKASLTVIKNIALYKNYKDIP